MPRLKQETPTARIERVLNEVLSQMVPLLKSLTLKEKDPAKRAAFRMKTAGPLELASSTYNASKDIPLSEPFRCRANLIKELAEAIEQF